MVFDKMSIKNKLTSILAILTIIVLGISATTQYIHTEMSSDGNVINIAGKQRSLIQITAKESFAISAGYSERKKNLKEIAELFDSTLDDLINGNEARDIPPAKGEIKSQLLYVKELWKPFYENVKVIYAKDPDDPEFKEALQYISDHNMKLLYEMNKAVSLYSAKYKEKIDFANQITIIISILALLIVIGSITIIKKTVINQLNQLDKLEKMAHELINKNYNVELKLVIYNDEIGAIYQNIQKILDNIKKGMIRREKDRKELEDLFNNISNIMNKVADGNLTVRLEEKESNEELVGRAINKAISKMADLISGLRGRIEKLNEELEISSTI